MPPSVWKPRRIIAPIVGLLTAGAGHFTVGKYRRGLMWFGIDAGAVLLGVIGVLISATILGPFLGVLLVVRIVSVVDVVSLPAADPARVPGWGKTVLLWIGLIVVGQVMSVSIRANLVEAFRIPAGSMIPTLLVGDHIFVNKLSREPKRGEVIVFRYPKDPEKDFVKRIVAVGGDTIELRDHEIWLNGKVVERHHVDSNCTYEDRDLDDATRWEQRSCDQWRESIDGVSYSVVFNQNGGSSRSFPPFSVPPNTVYVLGDNRDNSHDSRYWGVVPVENIKGRALSIWWSSGGSGIRWSRLGQRVQ